MSDLALSGLASGFDWKAVVEQLIEIERMPQQRLQFEQQENNDKISSLGQIKSQLDSLKTAADELGNDGIFDARSVSLSSLLSSSSPSNFLSASAESGTLVGTYSVSSVSLATATLLTGDSDVGPALNAANSIDSLNIPTAIGRGKFTINGNGNSNILEIGADSGDDFDYTDTLTAAFTAIQANLSGDGASARIVNDRALLQSDQSIILGHPNDTTNLWGALKLFSTPDATNYSNPQSNVEVSIGGTGTTTVGDSYSVTVAGTPYTYISGGGENSAAVASGLASLISADTNLNVSSSGGTIHIVGKTYNANVTGSAASVTVDATGDDTIAVGNDFASAEFVQQQTSDTATKSYAIGDWVYRSDNSTLYQITSSVAAGSNVSGSASAYVGYLAPNQYATESTVNLGATSTSKSIDSIATNTAIASTSSGSFTVNGLSINYDTTKDNLADIIKRVNASTADVSMSYDPLNDQFALRNNETGKQNISISDTSGNLMGALKLTSGTTAYGKDGEMIFSINGGSNISIKSQSNTYNGSAHGIEGLSITAKKSLSSNDDPITVSINSDVGAAKGKISNFVDKYNNVINVIESNTKKTVDGDNVTTAILSDNLEISRLGSSLRRIVFGDPDGHAKSSVYNTGIERVQNIGLDFSSSTGRLLIEDESALEDALRDKGAIVQALFDEEITSESDSGFERDGVTARNNGTKSFGGIAQYLQGFIGMFNDGNTTITNYPGGTTNDTDGTIEIATQSLQARNKRIDERIANLERLILAEEERLTNSFIQMESAQSQIQNQLASLQSNIQ